MSTKSAPVDLPVPSPINSVGPAALAVGFGDDVRTLFGDISKKTPRDDVAERAFIASKLHIARTQPTLDLGEREVAGASLGLGDMAAYDDSVAKSGPVPGGVGYGMFYNPAFKKNWSTGTAIYYDIISPTPPGGNVNTFLYLTATNRSGKGVEAFVSYNGQNQTFFKVFDWARYPTAQWQTNIPFANLGNYCRVESSHGHPYQVIPLMNVTYQSAPNHWFNQVWLYNHVSNKWDLTYQFDYAATLAEQQGVWVGSWGPIVETFQTLYTGTKPMGAINTQLISRAGTTWGAWHSLGSADSTVRVDNVGFHPNFLDPNHTWAVNS